MRNLLIALAVIIALSCTKDEKVEPITTLAGTKWERYNPALALLERPYEQLEFTTDVKGVHYLLDENKTVIGQEDFTYAIDDNTRVGILYGTITVIEQYRYKGKTLVLIKDDGTENKTYTYKRVYD